MTADTGVTPELAETFRTALEEQRARLQERLRELEAEGRTLAIDEGEESGPGGQSADVATNLVEHEIGLTLEHSLARQVEEIEAALGRLADGSYGRCEQCGGAIGIDRLRALPWTRYCIQCARRM
jgi:RNA polymerase-binding protein DksA